MRGFAIGYKFYHLLPNWDTSCIILLFPSLHVPFLGCSLPPIFQFGPLPLLYKERCFLFTNCEEPFWYKQRCQPIFGGKQDGLVNCPILSLYDSCKPILVSSITHLKPLQKTFAYARLKRNQ